MKQPTLRELYEDGWSLIPADDMKKAQVTWTPYQSVRATWEQIETWGRNRRPPIWSGITGGFGRFSPDFDGEVGIATLRALGLDPHRRSANGFHVDIWTPDWEVKTFKKDRAGWKDLAPGVDIRGHGGYINLLGASRTGPYEWLHREPPYPIDVLPEEWLPYLRRTVPSGTPRPSGGPPVMGSEDPDTHLNRALAAVDAGGGRNNSGFDLAMQLRDNRFTKDEGWTVMADYQAACPPTNTKGIIEPYTLDDSRRSLDQAYSRAPREPWSAATASRELIITNRDFRTVTDDAVNALIEHNDPPTIFRQGLTVVEVNETDVVPKVVPFKVDRLRRLLSVLAEWVTVTYDTDNKPTYRPTHPTANAMKSLLSSDAERFPTLRGIVEAPFPREDGSVVTEDGYDESSGMWLKLPKGLDIPPVPDEPSDEQVAAARTLIEDMMKEFAFVDDASKANAMGLLLTCVLRTGIKGQMAMAVISANSAGTGKTLLAQVCAEVALGHDPAMKPAPSGNDEELRKLITSTLAAGTPIIVFDNLAKPLKSPYLAQALSEPVWSDRILGASKNVDLPQHSVWVTTGNNIQTTEELSRRCYPIFLDAKVYRPWERAFERQDLPQWVSDHRGSLLSACLTLWRAWCSRGRPFNLSPRMKLLDGFYAWQRTVGGMLQVAGVDGFMENASEFQNQTDPDLVLWEGLLRRWLRETKGQPVMAKQLAPLMDGVELPSTLAEYLSTAGETNRVTRLGRKLGTVKGQRFNADGLRIERAPSNGHEKVAMWKVVTGQ